MRSENPIEILDAFSSGLSTSRGPLTPRRDVIMDIVSDNRSNKGRDRDIHNSVPTQSVMQLTERARDSPILKTTSIGELIERETFLQEWSLLSVRECSQISPKEKAYNHCGIFNYCWEGLFHPVQ